MIGLALVVGVAGGLFFEELVDGFVDLLVGEPELESAMNRGGGEVAKLLAAIT